MITRCQAGESLEQLGSGVRNLFKISVPLDDNYSLDHGNGANGDSGCGIIDTISADRVRESSIPYAADRRSFSFSEKSAGILSREEAEILDRVKKNPHLRKARFKEKWGYH